MPRLVNRNPRYCKHKASGQATVTIDGTTIYLGLYGSKGSKAEYDRVIAEYLASGRRLPGSARTADLSVNELLVAFLRHAETYYRRPDGTPTQKIADYFERTLAPMADFVLDFHSGGKTLDFVPFAAAHRLEAAVQEAACIDAMRAFNAPYSMVLLEIDNVGMFDTAVEGLGKVFVSTELGGGGTATARSIAIARGLGDIVYTVVSLALAPRYAGWAMVWGNIVRGALVATLMIIMSNRGDWLYPVRLRLATIKAYFAYGWPIGIGAITEFISQRWDNLLVSRFYGEHTVGEAKALMAARGIPVRLS